MESGDEKVDTQEGSRSPCLAAPSGRSCAAAACCCWWGDILGVLGLPCPKLPLVCSLSTGLPPLLQHEQLSGHGLPDIEDEMPERLAHGAYAVVQEDPSPEKTTSHRDPEVERMPNSVGGGCTWQASSK